jgi:hypothetical protein
MIGEPDLVRLLYRADWTKLSLSADVVRLTSATEDGVVAGFEPEPPPWVRRLPWAPSGPWDDPSALRTRRATERLLVAPGGRYRCVQGSGEEGHIVISGCDGERAWHQFVQPGGRTRAQTSAVSWSPPASKLLCPSWLLSGFELELDGEAAVGGRNGYRITARPRPAVRASRPGALPRPDRVEATFDAELGILLRYEEIRREQTFLAEELQNVTTGPPETAHAAQFAPPPGSTPGPGLGEPFGEFFDQPGWRAAKTAAGFAATGLSYAIRYDPRRLWQSEDVGNAAMPQDDPGADAGSPGAGPPGDAPPPRDDVLYLLYRSGLAPRDFTAEFHEWTDTATMVQHARSAERKAGIAGLGALAEPINDRAPVIHRVATIRVAGIDRYRIDYTSREPKDRPKTIACDGERRWRVYGNRVAIGSAVPLPGEFAQLIDPCWLLAGRLSDKGEVTVHGRRGFRLGATRSPDGIGSWPAPAHIMFSSAEAVVDAELGILLRLAGYDGGQPVMRIELRDVARPGTPEPGDFGVDVPAGMRTVKDRGGLLDEAGAPEPVKMAARTVGGIVRGAAEGAAAVSWFLDTVRSKDPGAPPRTHSQPSDREPPES